MSEEIKELKETLERSLQNPLLIDREKTERFYKGIINLQQKVEQLENIRKEAIDFIKNKIEYYNGKRLEDTKYEYINIDIIDDLLNILNKGE